MFLRQVQKSRTATALTLLGLIFHGAVRSVRQRHGNAVISLLLNILQAVLFVAIFFVMFYVLGMRGGAIRGDFLLYVMSGIFMFMTHNQALGAVVGADGPTSPMMKHAPMNTLVSISSAALAVLYTQVLSASVLLYLYHVLWQPITIHDPVGTIAMFLLSWGSGVGVGMIFMALKPWAPTPVTIAATIYRRANMIASGKMFVANALPGFMLAMFDWNPLFHTIDQGRGFIFLNYNPHNSSIAYPVYVMLVCMMLGLIAEHYTRKHVSLSWSAGR